jgi:hypothetical protein
MARQLAHFHFYWFMDAIRRSGFGPREKKAAEERGGGKPGKKAEREREREMIRLGSGWPGKFLAGWV